MEEEQQHATTNKPMLDSEVTGKKGAGVEQEQTKNNRNNKE